MAQGPLLCWLLCVLIIQVDSQISVGNYPTKSEYRNSLQLKHGFSLSAKEKPFLNLFNLAVKECAYECQIRTECQAINYGRLSKKCRLFGTNTSELKTGPANNPRVYLRKSDIIESSPSLNVSSICPNCSLNATCDVETGQCVIRECRKGTWAHAWDVGNVLALGSHINVVCNAWYANIAPRNTTCLPNGTWSYQDPCIYEFPCGIPPLLPNAYPKYYIYEQDVRVVLYDCKVGYDAPLTFRDMTLNCLNTTLGMNPMGGGGWNGSSNISYVWAEPEFECIRNCSTPPMIEGASVSLGEDLEGNTKTYTCGAGYVLNETSTLNGTIVANTTCQTNGNWSDVSIQCLPVCGTPPEIDNGLPIAVHYFADGTFLEYECDIGYGTTAPNLPTNNTVIKCFNGTWEDPSFFDCLRDCYEPPDISNSTTDATVLSGGTLEGAVREYTCGQGNAVNGSALITCQPDGNWTSPDFECVPECEVPATILNADSTYFATYFANNGIMSTATSVTQECEVPATILNADSTYFDNNGIASKATYLCYPGYMLTNADHSMTTNESFTLTCPHPGPWSLPNGTCLIDCLEPPEIENATLSVNDTLEGTTRNYTCFPGFYVNGSGPTSTTCQPDGNWTTMAFQCSPVCGLLPEVTNGFAVSVTTDVENRTYVEYVCDVGYATADVHNVTALECLNGTWEEPYFQCVRDCFAPPQIDNDALPIGNTLEGTTRNYTCLPGFYVNGSEPTSTTCQPDGNWTAMEFQCSPVCGPVPEITNGFVVGTTTGGNGTFLEYACDDGYVLYNNSHQLYNATVVECLNGTWDDLQFHCRRECDFPPATANAIFNHTVSINTTTTGARYICVPGYSVTIPSVPLGRMCHLPGQWCAPNQQCLRDCYQPPAMQNATLLHGNTLEGTTRRYKCITGYLVNGSQPKWTTCQSDGTWTAVEFQCIPNWCPSGWIPFHGYCFNYPPSTITLNSNSLTYCEATYPGSIMVQLETAYKEAQVIAFLEAHYLSPICIGLCDQFMDGNWTWYGTDTPMTYSNFAPTEPTEGDRLVRMRLAGGGGVWKWQGSQEQCVPVCELQ